MPKTIFTKTLWEKRWMIAAWSGAMLLLTWLTLIFYPSFSQSGGFDQVLQSLPPQLRSLMGDIASLKTFGGYVNTQIFALRTPMFTLVMAIALGVGLTAAEEEQGTLQNLLSLPVSRIRVLLEKFLAMMVVIGTIHVGVFLGLVVGAFSIHERYSYWLLAQATLNCAILSLCFGAIAFALGAATGRRGVSVAGASLIAFLSFLINSFAESVENLKPLAKLTLFHIYSRTSVAVHGLDMVAVLIMLGVSFGALFLGAGVFRWRDLRN